MSYVTRDQVYANKTIQILDAWSSTLTSLVGINATLLAAMAPGATYMARLHFAETYWTAAGSRRFRRVISFLHRLKQSLLQGRRSGTCFGREAGEDSAVRACGAMADLRAGTDNLGR